MPQSLPSAVSSDLEFEDFFETTLKEPLASTDTDIYLNEMPLSTNSFLVIDPKGDNPEIIYFNEVGGNYVRCPSATDGQGRGVFNTSPQDWDAGVEVGNYTVAAMFEAIVTGVAMRGSFFTPTGTIVPYAGSVAPDGWLMCDGSSVLQSDHAALFAVIGTNYGPSDATHFSLPDMRGRTPLGVGARTWALSFDASAVNASTDQITITANKNVYTGKAVVLSTTSSAPGGLTAGSTYYIVVVDSTHIQLATSLANAIAGTVINITTQGAGTHTLTFTGTNHALAETGGEDTHAMTQNEMPAHTHQQLIGGGVATAQSGSGTVAGTANNSNVSSTGGSAGSNVLNPYVGLNFIIKT